MRVLELEVMANMFWSLRGISCICFHQGDYTDLVLFVKSVLLAILPINPMQSPLGLYTHIDIPSSHL